MKNFVYKSDYSKGTNKHSILKRMNLELRIKLQSFKMLVNLVSFSGMKLTVFENILLDFDTYAQDIGLKIEAVIDYEDKSAHISVLGHSLYFFTRSDTEKLNYAIKNADKVYIFDPQAEDMTVSKCVSPDDYIGLNIVINCSSKNKDTQ